MIRFLPTIEINAEAVQRILALQECHSEIVEASWRNNVCTTSAPSKPESKIVVLKSKIRRWECRHTSPRFVPQ